MHCLYEDSQSSGYRGNNPNFRRLRLLSNQSKRMQPSAEYQETAFIVLYALLNIAFLGIELTSVYFRSFKQYSAKHKDNFVMSPFSVQNILALATIGAKSITTQELSTALHLSYNHKKIQHTFYTLTQYLNKSRGYRLKIRNIIYIDEDVAVSDLFRMTARKKFSSDVQTINCKKKRKTAWFIANSLGKISDTAEEIRTCSTNKALFISATYLKTDFNVALAKASRVRFYMQKNKIVIVSGMHLRSKLNYFYNKLLKAEFLEIPFDGDDIVMTIALPIGMNGLSSLEQSIFDVLLHQPYQRIDVVVNLPKFSMATSINFIPILKNLGVTSSFENEANFSGITNEPLSIGAVVQKTLIEVAVPTEDTLLEAGTRPRIEYNADHPFIYYLRHKVLGVVLVGRYTKPQEVDC